MKCAKAMMTKRNADLYREARMGIKTGSPTLEHRTIWKPCRLRGVCREFQKTCLRNVSSMLQPVFYVGQRGQA